MERCPRTRDYGNRSKSKGVGVRQLAAALVNDRLFQGALRAYQDSDSRIISLQRFRMRGGSIRSDGIDVPFACPPPSVKQLRGFEAAAGPAIP